MSHTYAQEMLSEIPKAGFNQSELSPHQKDTVNNLSQNMINAVNLGVDVNEVLKFSMLLGLLQEKSGLSQEQLLQCRNFIYQDCLNGVPVDDISIDALILRMRQHLGLPPV